MKKRFLLLFMISVLLVLVTGCGEAKEATNFDFNKSVMKAINQSIVDKYQNVSDLEYDYYIHDGSDLEKAAVEGFKMAQDTDHVGAFVDFEQNDDHLKIVDGSDGQILCTTRCIFKNRNVDITVYYKENREYNLQKNEIYSKLAQEAMSAGFDDLNKYISQYYAQYGFNTESVDLFLDDVLMNNSGITPYTAVDCEVSAVYAKPELLKKAGINTGIGMGTVFVVLIFIAFIIYLMRFIPVLFGGKKKEEQKVEKKPAAAQNALADKKVPLPPAFVADDNENLVDDTELTAVITAALMAYLGSGSGEKPAAYTDSADGLVVRSIRRVR